MRTANLAELFEKYPYMPTVLRASVNRNGYHEPEVYFPEHLRLSAGNKCHTLDGLRFSGLMGRDRRLTESGVTVASRLLS